MQAYLVKNQAYILLCCKTKQHIAPRNIETYRCEDNMATRHLHNKITRQEDSKVTRQLHSKTSRYEGMKVARPLHSKIARHEGCKVKRHLDVKKQGGNAFQASCTYVATAPKVTCQIPAGIMGLITSQLGDKIQGI